MVERSYGDALCQIDMIADCYRADYCAMKPDARVITNTDVAYSIVDTAERFYHTILAKRKLSVGWGVHPHTTVYLRTATTMLIERRQYSDVPSGACISLVHDDTVQQMFQSWTCFQPFSHRFFVFHGGKGTTKSVKMQILW